MSGSESGVATWRKVAFGAGDFGFNFSWQFTSIFLLFFYTDVVGLSPSSAGLIYMVALVCDAVIDPYLGDLTGRTRSRFGRYRPWLLFGAIPLGLSIPALMFLPLFYPGHAMLVAATTHVLFRLIFAITNIPYSALMARITDNTHDRTDLASMRMLFANVAGTAVALATQPSVAWLGDGNEALGWGRFGFLLAFVTTLFLWLAAFATAGLDEAETRLTETAQKQPSMRRQLVLLSRNKAFFVVAAGIFIAYFTVVFFQKTLIYWFTYALNDRGLSGTALAISPLVALVTIPIWTRMLKTYRKNYVAIAGALVCIAGYGLFYLIGSLGPVPAFVAIVLVSAGASAGLVSFWAMIPDTIEYGEWRCGERTEGFTFGMIMLILKGAMGLGAGLLGVSLDAIGYHANAVQSPETLNRLLLLMAFVPAAGLLVKAVLLLAYPIDHRGYATMMDELRRRRAERGVETALEAA
jgi:glycoside/pentoside/hexuronide:cation symporter, GPH family